MCESSQVLRAFFGGRKEKKAVHCGIFDQRKRSITINSPQCWWHHNLFRTYPMLKKKTVGNDHILSLIHIQSSQKHLHLHEKSMLIELVNSDWNALSKKLNWNYWNSSEKIYSICPFFPHSNFPKALMEMFYKWLKWIKDIFISTFCNN